MFMFETDKKVKGVYLKENAGSRDKRSNSTPRLTGTQLGGKHVSPPTVPVDVDVVRLGAHVADLLERPDHERDLQGLEDDQHGERENPVDGVVVQQPQKYAEG